MDTSDPLIVFDQYGFCNHCRTAIEKREVQNGRTNNIDELVDKLKRWGKNKKYDCVIGVSGGVDSSYVAYLCKQNGLRPLAVHMDNGWNSELSILNIQVLLDKLNIELHTEVLDWDSFRDLQLAFLKSSTSDIEIPTDHAISGVLLKIALNENVPLVLGVNSSSEAILPSSWSQGHLDWAYIKKVHSLYGQKSLKNYPHVSLAKHIYFYRVRRIPVISILDSIDYDKEKAKEFLISKFNWRDYGGKHYESFFTKFYQSYILPTKFGYDKRRAHFSSLIVANQLSREEALDMLSKPLFDPQEINHDITYFIKKMQISAEEFEDIMNNPPRRYEDISPLFNRKLRRIEKSFFKKMVQIKNKFK